MEIKNYVDTENNVEHVRRIIFQESILFSGLTKKSKWNKKCTCNLAESLEISGLNQAELELFDLIFLAHFEAIPFLYPLQALENLHFLCFQWVWKWHIDWKWVRSVSMQEKWKL